MRSKLLAVFLPALLLSLAVAAFGDAELAEIRSLIGQGKSTEALAALDEHLERSPVDPEGLFLRALLLAESRQEDRALEVFQEISSLRPDRPEPLNNLAVIQASKGDYEAAVETLKEALRTHPAYRTVYENLTKIYGQLASEAYSRALSIDQARSRSSVELVLLSDMVLPENLESRVAKLPSQADDSGAVAGGDALPVESELEGISQAEEATVEAAEVVLTPPIAEELADTAPESVDSQGSRSALEDSAEPSQTPEQAIEEALADAPDEAPTQSVVESASESVAAAGLASLVEAWAQAWSEQRVDDYLYFYGRDFVPAGEIGREDWEQLRRERIARPEFVRVSVAFLDFEAEAEDRALVRFNQSYESNTFSDVVTKTLELAWESGEWKIVRETVD